MDKTREIFKKVWVAHFGHSEQLDTDLEAALGHDYIFEAMQQYADEVSRERFIQFHQWLRENNLASFSMEKLKVSYDEWKSKQ